MKKLSNNIKGLSEATRALMDGLITQVRTEAYAEGFEVGKVFAAEEAVKRVGLARKSPNQLRAELILKAKFYIEDIEDIKFYRKGNRVTCVFNSSKAKRVYKVGRSNCNPNDVFNLFIGQAIALGRALQIDIPIEFLEAVQPDNWAVGQIVTFRKGGSYHMKMNYQVDSIVESHNNLTKLFEDGKASADLTDGKIHSLPIIDDTNAQYEKGKCL